MVRSACLVTDEVGEVSGKEVTECNCRLTNYPQCFMFRDKTNDKSLMFKC